MSKSYKRKVRTKGKVDDQKIKSGERREVRQMLKEGEFNDLPNYYRDVVLRDDFK